MATTPQPPVSLWKAIVGALALVGVAGAIVYGFGMALKVMDRAGGPSVTVSGCADADRVVSVTDLDHGTLLTLRLGDERTVNVMLRPDAEARLTPNSWRDGRVNGYESLALTAVEGAETPAYQVALPTDRTMVLSYVNVRCTAYGNVELSLSITPWTWTPGFNTSVYIHHRF
jgi:hypothetical protein